jgi:hypothetical protein
MNLEHKYFQNYILNVISKHLITVKRISMSYTARLSLMHNLGGGGKQHTKPFGPHFFNSLLATIQSFDDRATESNH